jgi:formyl-CoA transferase
MQDAVLNLCRVKLRDQQRLDRTHTLQEYPQYPDGEFGDAVPRAGNASGGGQPGAILKCKGWETDPNAYIYFITQAAVWPAICQRDRPGGLDRGPGLCHPAGGCATSRPSSSASSSGR